jgi:uncharacterized membrane protein YcaP (DUF421 family)
MNGWEKFWGSGEDLTALQMSVRALCMFFITLLLIRLSGMRTFGKNTAFDIIITIMLGAILSRGITGASSFSAVVAAAAVMVIIHRVLAMMSMNSPSISKIIEGESRLLYKNGKIQWKNMKRSSLSLHDLEESIRQELNENSFDNIDEIYIESNGKISVVKKEDR